MYDRLLERDPFTLSPTELLIATRENDRRLGIVRKAQAELDAIAPAVDAIDEFIRRQTEADFQAFFKAHPTTIGTAVPS